MGVPAVGPTQTSRVNCPTTTPAGSNTPATSTARPTPPAQRDTFEAGPVRPSPAPAAQPATTPATVPGSGAQPSDTQRPVEPGSVSTTGSTGGGRVHDPADVAARNGVPFISQLTPDGAAETYQNGDFNCAPASFAMVARKAGYGAELSDAELITELANVGKTIPGEGTSMNGALAMAQKIGLAVDRSEVSFPGFNNQWLDEQLAAGKTVVANGALQTPEGPSGHFIVVTGKDDQGNYKINDPLAPERRSLTADQLGAFLARNPLHKGASIALG